METTADRKSSVENKRSVGPTDCAPRAMEAMGPGVVAATEPESRSEAVSLQAMRRSSRTWPGMVFDGLDFALGQWLAAATPVTGLWPPSQRWQSSSPGDARLQVGGKRPRDRSSNCPGGAPAEDDYAQRSEFTAA